MDSVVNYDELYRLQDEVLTLVVGCDTDFYLTGGTCLHRFITRRRYSDDLDFFCNDNNLYRSYVREVMKAFNDSSLDYEMVTDTRDFVRIHVVQSLQVDFVNDRVPRFGHSLRTPEGFLIDNLDNILANKLSAIIGRDEAKDIFDVISIDEITDIDWKTAIERAREKSLFEPDYLIYRLKSFPLRMLDDLNIVKPEYLIRTKEEIPRIVQAIENC